ncbi:hypothetical protein MHH81_11750 [Psychrobacillus sp. FSL H8-0484]|uniref:hypothetical protein n=1 Tax=Psychrobacillus sp. FSL H8-0484 TaxID=2921390 RepID=UPI0030FA047D
MKLKHLILLIIVFSSLWITGCSNETNKEGEVKENEFPPSMTGLIRINETEYEMIVGNYKWEIKQGLETQVVQTDAASPYQIAENVKAIIIEESSNIKIEIEGNPEISVYLWNENGREKEVKVDKNQLSVPTSKGQYIYEVLAKWSNGEVSYTFVIEIR